MANQIPRGSLLQYLRIRNANIPGYVTCTGKHDGLGAQLHAVLSTQAFARSTSITYAHTPFRRVEHALGAVTSWTKRCEDFLDLGRGELSAQEVGIAPIELSLFLEDPRRWSQPYLIAVPHAHEFTELHIDSYSPVIKNIQKRCHAEKSSFFLQNVDVSPIMIAIHVRRNDVSASLPRRYTPNEYVLEVIHQLRHLVTCEGIQAHIDLYSEGMVDDFQDFSQIGCSLHLNEDPFSTFCRLAAADVLITAKSSFSYVAALLSRGVVLYEPFWHAPLVNWIPLGSDTLFDKSHFRRSLHKHLRSKELRKTRTRS